MPNWEPATYEITDTGENILLLESEVDKALGIDAPSDFHHWLGKLMMHIGYTYDEVRHSSNGCPNCRGEIVDRWATYTPYFNEYHITTETAWAPMDECIATFVRHFCPDAVINRTQVIEVTEEI